MVEILCVVDSVVYIVFMSLYHNNVIFFKKKDVCVMMIDGGVRIITI